MSSENTYLESRLSQILPKGLIGREKETTPLVDQLNQQAHADILSNVVEENGRRYFGAGRNFGAMLYTRDIAFAGIFACNEYYPEIMLDSIRETRRVHLEAYPWLAASSAIVSEINGPWDDAGPISEKEMAARFRTNSWTRRTDDVIWLWATHDLFEKNPALADWKWLLETGERCFDKLYGPFFNKNGLYSGQQCFVDVQDAQKNPHLRGGYPIEFTQGDCIRSMFLSTNSLYYRGMLALAAAAAEINESEKANHWRKRAEALKVSILTNLSDPEGRLCMMLEHTTHRLENRRDALGLALAVLFGILEGEQAQITFADYPREEWGIPLWDRFWAHDHCYHNHTAWPYVDTLFLTALEKVDGESHLHAIATCLARGCSIDGSFKELTDYRDGTILGSSNQLWTAAAWLYRFGR